MSSNCGVNEINKVTKLSKERSNAGQPKSQDSSAQNEIPAGELDPPEVVMNENQNK